METIESASEDSPGCSEPGQFRSFNKVEIPEPIVLANGQCSAYCLKHDACTRLEPARPHSLQALPPSPIAEASAEDTARESQQELQRLSGLLVSIQEDERRRIALDLHDGLGQSLSVIKLGIEGAARLLAEGQAAEALESLQRSIPRIKDAVAEVRRVSTELRPTMLDDLGILPTLSWFFRELEAASGSIRIDSTIAVAERDVPQPLQISLYRILQETMHNVVKHAAADRVTVQLERIGGELHLRIQDNGCGFNPQAPGSGHAKGLGLLSMKERASLSGGTLRMRSGPGQGTCICVSWPCANAPA